MRRQNAAVTVYEGKFGVDNPTAFGLAPQLPHRLDDVEHTAGRTRMSVREKAAMGVARQLPVEIERTTCDGRSSLAPPEEPDGFQFDKKCDGEAVIDLGHVDVGRDHARATEGLRRRLLASEIGKRWR